MKIIFEDWRVLAKEDKYCGNCNEGMIQCNSCQGQGHVQNKTYRTMSTCKNCNGIGKIDCTECKSQ